jgi:superfamily II DNA or RNA helicase
MTKKDLEYFKKFTNPLECKNEIHNHALLNHIKLGQRSSLFMSPGSGKTRVGIIAACENIKKYGGKWLVSVPKENLIKQWSDEAAKWKYSKEWKNVDCICHASNAKVNINNYNGIIIDEVHLAIKGEIHGSLLNFDYKKNNKKLLCLTGTKPTAELLEKLETVAPCAFELTLDEAVELKLVSEYIINVIDVPLLPKEITEYKKAQQQFIYYKYILGGNDAFDKATLYLKSSNASKHDKKNATMFYGAIRKRKTVAQNAENKLIIGKELIKLHKDYNIITFAETNAFTEALYKSLGDTALMFHSEMKKTEKDNTLKRFKDGRTKQNIICSTKALSEGFNVENISCAIILAFTSKSNTLIQRLARSIRYKEGKQAKIFILCVPDSQEELWLKSALKGVSNVKYYDSFETYVKNM